MGTRHRSRAPVAVIYTPAALAGNVEAGEEFDRVAAEHRIGSEKRIGKGMLADLRGQGWLRQARWRRGGYLTTAGLRSAVGLPELVMLNVPSVFAPWAHRVMKRICSYVIEFDTRLHPGEVFALKDPLLPAMAVTFDVLEPGDIQLPAFDQPMLVVIPLP